MSTRMIALMSFGAGAGLMYLADPRAGRRRRARLGDAIVHASHRANAAAARVSQDVENRWTGLVARTHASLGAAPPPSDDVLAARVRARLGRLVSHPGAIDATAREGLITLSGAIFEAEVQQLIAGVRRISGVTGVENRLEPHAQAGTVPALQGRGPLTRHRQPARVRWTPTTRLIAGAAGLTLMALAARRRTLGAGAVGLAGFELLEQAVRGAAA